jgi:hypothetical protein
LLFLCLIILLKHACGPHRTDQRLQQAGHSRRGLLSVSRLARHCRVYPSIPRRSVKMIGSCFSGMAVRKSKIAASDPLVPAFESFRRGPKWQTGPVSVPLSRQYPITDYYVNPKVCYRSCASIRKGPQPISLEADREEFPSSGYLMAYTRREFVLALLLSRNLGQSSSM